MEGSLVPLKFNSLVESRLSTALRSAPCLLPIHYRRSRRITVAATSKSFFISSTRDDDQKTCIRICPLSVCHRYWSTNAAASDPDRNGCGDRRREDCCAGIPTGVYRLKDRRVDSGLQQGSVGRPRLLRRAHTRESQPVSTWKI